MGGIGNEGGGGDEGKGCWCGVSGRVTVELVRGCGKGWCWVRWRKLNVFR